jgi:hypothetical protein
MNLWKKARPAGRAFALKVSAFEGQERGLIESRARKITDPVRPKGTIWAQIAILSGRVDNGVRGLRRGG